MPFKQKTTIVTLVNFSLILIFLLVRLFQLNRNGDFIASNVFRLWGITIIMAILISITGTVLTQIVSAVLEAVWSGDENPQVDFFEDERDNLIDLRGTKITYLFSSIGSFIAMLTFYFGQPALIMFTLLILFGIIAQIVGDVARLVLYQRGLE